MYGQCHISYFKLLYLREQGACLKDYYILGQGSYITFRLTGHRAVSDCMASGSGLMNIHSRRYDAALLDTLDVDEECLSPIHHYTETLPLDAEGAALLGLRPGIPVIPVCSDGGLNQIAIGGYRMGAMSFSVGTSAAIRLSTQKPVLPDHPATWCYLSPVGYMSGAAPPERATVFLGIRMPFCPAWILNRSKKALALWAIRLCSCRSSW